MTNTKPSKTEPRSNEHSKGNLGQKEAQLEKEKDSNLSHMGEKSTRRIRNERPPQCGQLRRG